MWNKLGMELNDQFLSSINIQCYNIYKNQQTQYVESTGHGGSSGNLSIVYSNMGLMQWQCMCVKL